VISETISILNSKPHPVFARFQTFDNLAIVPVIMVLTAKLPRSLHFWRSGAVLIAGTLLFDEVEDYLVTGPRALTIVKIAGPSIMTTITGMTQNGGTIAQRATAGHLRTGDWGIHIKASPIVCQLKTKISSTRPTGVEAKGP
jgi:hypothetical protein